MHRPFLLCKGSDLVLGFIYVFDLDGQHLRTAELGQIVYTNEQFTHDQDTLYIGHETGDISVWNLETGQRMRTIRHHDARVTNVTFVREQTLAAGLGDGMIQLICLRSDTVLQTIQRAHESSIRCIGYDERTDIAVTAGEDATVKAWRLSTGERLHRLSLSHPESAITSWAWNTPGREAVLGDSHGKLRIWDVETG